MRAKIGVSRETWLLKVVSELWSHRGLYPGLLKVLKAAGVDPLIAPAKALCIAEGHAKGLCGGLRGAGRR